MASVIIRNIDEQTKARLQQRAAKHGRSVEDEAHDILQTVLASDTPQSIALVDSIRARIEPLGGVELQIAPRDPMRDPGAPEL